MKRKSIKTTTVHTDQNERKTEDDAKIREEKKREEKSNNNNSNKNNKKKQRKIQTSVNRYTMRTRSATEWEL